MAPPNYLNLLLSRSGLDQLTPQNGVATGLLQLLNDAVAATKGEWTQWSPFHKGSFEVTGITVATVELYTSNNETCPLNGQTLTIGGSVTAGDVLSIVINAPSLSVSASYTTVGGDTVDTIATALAAAIKAAIIVQQQQSELQDYQDQSFLTEINYLEVSVSGAVVTINWVFPLVGVQITSSVSGAATETITAAEYDSGLGFGVPNCTLTANGNVQFDQSALWIKAAITAYTSHTGSGISANVVGSIP